MTEPACPRCNGANVRSGRIGIGGGIWMYDMVCQTCGLYEDRRSDADDFEVWWKRWHAAAPAAAPVPAPRAVAAARDSYDDDPALLAAVCAAPDDDAPRLAYADAITSREPERAELIRLQLARANAERAADALEASPGQRESELLERYGAAWAHAIDPFARPTKNPRPDPGWGFERGFVELLRTTPDIVEQLGARLFELAPIRHLELAPRSHVAPAVLGSPLLGRLRSLTISQCELDDAAAGALAANAHLAGLRWLDLRDNAIGERGVAALAASPRIRAIPFVLLTNNPVDPAHQYSLDWDGSITDSWLPELATDLEAKYGPIGWLHLEPSYRLADRFHV